MKISKVISIAIFAAVFGGSVTVSSDELKPSLFPSPIQRILDRGATVRELDPAYGQRVFEAINKGSRAVLYLTADEKGLIAGVMFGENGQAITAQTLKASLPTKVFEPATSIKIGNGEPQIIAFVDPLCPHCSRFWRQVCPAIEQGALTVLAVPIGAIGSDNGKYARSVAAALSQDANPSSAWLAYAANKMLPLKAPSDEMVARIRNNNLLYASFGFSKTPAFLIKNEGSGYQKIQGLTNKLYQSIDRLKHEPKQGLLEADPMLCSAFNS